MPPAVAPIAPTEPSPTVPSSPTVAPPPPSPPPLSTLTELASQRAGQISNQTQFEAALTSVGGATLPADAKGKLWETVNKTRVGQGLQPLQIAPPPPASGMPTVPTAVDNALPASVTGRPPTPAPPGAPAPGNTQSPSAAVPPPPANPLAQTAPPQPTAASLGLQTPQDKGPLGPDGQPMAYPNAKRVDFTPAKYEPPKKGLLYAAAALSLLFPGSPIGKAAGSFAQGLNRGAEQKYEREEKTAEQKFQADKANAQADYQNAVAKYGAASEQAHRAFLNQQVVNGATVEAATAAWQANAAALGQRQKLYTEGLGPDGKPIPAPAAISKPPGPKSGAEVWAAYESRLAGWYNTNGMTGPGSQHAAAATQYQKQVQDAAHQAAELQRTMLTIQAGYARTNATIAAAADRQLSEFRQQYAMLGAHERDQYREQATRSNNEANKLWVQLTTPITDSFGQTKPPIVAKGSDLEKGITGVLNTMKTDRHAMVDPVGYAQWAIDHTPSLKDNPIAQQVIQGRADALEWTLKGNGYQPMTFIPPAPVDSATVLKHAGVNASDPRVKAWRAQAVAGHVDPDSPEAIAAMKHDLGGGARPPAAGAPGTIGAAGFSTAHAGEGAGALFDGIGNAIQPAPYTNPARRPWIPPPGGSQGASGPSQPGLIAPGNIDLHHRPVVKNADGSISTVRSISITDDKGRAILIPTVVGNRVVSNAEAIAHYRQTGQHLGIFNSEDAADKYAQTLHKQQAAEYLPNGQ